MKAKALLRVYVVAGLLLLSGGVAKSQFVFQNYLKPSSSTFPIVNQDHIKGGYHVVDNPAQLLDGSDIDGLHKSKREIGMLVLVLSESKSYVLVSLGVDDEDASDDIWQEVYSTTRYMPLIPYKPGFLAVHENSLYICSADFTGASLYTGEPLPDTHWVNLGGASGGDYALKDFSNVEGGNIVDSLFADNAVSTRAIDDYAITSIKLGSNAVTGAKLDNSIVGAGLDFDNTHNLMVAIDSSTIVFKADTLTIANGGLQVEKLRSNLGSALGNGASGQVLSSDGAGNFKWLNSSSLSVDPSNISLGNDSLFIGVSGNAAPVAVGGDLNLTVLNGDSAAFMIADNKIGTDELNLAGISIGDFEAANSTIDLNGNKIINLADPVDDGDAANFGTVKGTINDSILSRLNDKSSSYSQWWSAGKLVDTLGNYPLIYPTTGKIDGSVIPSISINTTFVVDSLGQILSLNSILDTIVHQGDIAIDTTYSASYMFIGHDDINNAKDTLQYGHHIDTLSVPASYWVPISFGNVISVNGKQGVVQIDLPDLPLTQAGLASKENQLGNPATDGEILTSSNTGVRTWRTTGTLLGTVTMDNLSDVSNYAGAGDSTMLVYDGSNWQAVKLSGDVVIGDAGITRITDDAVELGTNTTGNYVQSVNDLTSDGLSVSGNGEGGDVNLQLNVDDSTLTIIDDTIRLMNGAVRAGNMKASSGSLGNGTDGQVLSADGFGGFEWMNPSALSVNPNNIALDSASLLIGNTSDLAQAQTLSGDAKIDMNGVLRISDDAITLSKVATDAVNSDKIVDESIVSEDILNGTITALDIADNGITAAKIQPGIAGAGLKKDVGNDSVYISTDNIGLEVVNDKLQIKDDAISSSKIVDRGISGVDINQLGATNYQQLTWNGFNWVAATDSAIYTGFQDTIGIGATTVQAAIEKVYGAANAVNTSILTKVLEDSIAIWDKVALDSTEIMNKMVALANVGDAANTYLLTKISADSLYYLSLMKADSAALQAELDATQTGAGLNTDGTYTANVAIPYVGAATNLKDADEILAAQLFALNTQFSDTMTWTTDSIRKLYKNVYDLAQVGQQATFDIYGKMATDSLAIWNKVASDNLSGRNFLNDTLVSIIDSLTLLRSDLSSLDPLPSQGGNAGRMLVTDGTTASWDSIRSNNLGFGAVTASKLNITDANKAGAAGNVLSSNADGSFYWQDAASLSVDPSSLTLSEGSIYVGNASNQASGQTPSVISLDKFGVPVADLDVNTHKLINVVNPTDAQDAATKKYVDDSTAVLRAEIFNLQDSISAHSDSITDLRAEIEAVAVSGDNTALQEELDATQLGSGLQLDGSYVNNSGVPYIDGAGSLYAADQRLADSLKLLETAANNTLLWAQDTVRTLAEDIVALSEADALSTTEIYTKLSDDSTAVWNKLYADSLAGRSLVNDTLVSIIDSLALLRADLSSLDPLPAQAGNAGRILVTDGTTASWDSIRSNNLGYGAVTASKLSITDANKAGAAGNVLSSNADGTFYWQDAASLSVDPSSIALGTGSIFVGNASSKAESQSPSVISLDKFGAPVADLDVNTHKLTNVVDPTDAQDAATKKYVDDSAAVFRAEIIDINDSINAHTDSISTLRAAIAAAVVGGDNTALQTELDATQVGAGLQLDGSYTNNIGVPYIDGAGSLYTADQLLADSLKLVETAANNTLLWAQDTVRTLAEDIVALSEADALSTTEIYTKLSDDSTAVWNKLYADSLAGRSLVNDTLVSIIDSLALLRADLNSLDPLPSQGGNAGRMLVTDGTTASWDSIRSNNLGYGAVTASKLNITDANKAGSAGNVLSSNADGTFYWQDAASLSVDPSSIALGTGSIFVGNASSKAESQSPSVISLDKFGVPLADLDVNTHKLTNVVNPTDAQDAATKKYVDDSTAVLRAEIFNLQDSINAHSDSIADLRTAIASVAANGDNTALQTEVDATQTGTGLNADGTFTASSGTNYINGATTLKNATELLDAQVKTNTDAITAGTGAIQTELDASQAGSGLHTDGSYNNVASSNYISSASSLSMSDSLLDIQVKLNYDSIAAHNSRLLALTDSNAVYRDSINAHSDSIADLRTAIASVAANGDNSALQTELDASQAGAGLGTDGAYAANSSANYISGAGSLKAADDLLDAQAKVNADAVGAEATARSNADIALQSELDASQTGTGLNADGTFTASSGTNYINGAITLKNATELLDAQVKTNTDALTAGTGAIQTELDASQTGAGLHSDGSYNNVASSNYISSASSLSMSDSLLDIQVKLNYDSIAAHNSRLLALADSNGVYRDSINAYSDSIADLRTAIASVASSGDNTLLQTELDGIEAGSGLNSDGSYNNIASSNYVSGSSSLSMTDSLLDVQIKLNEDSILAHNTRLLAFSDSIDAHRDSISALRTAISDAAAAAASQTIGELDNVGSGADTETAGNILVADGDSWEGVALSGDATLSSAGVVTLEDDAVTTLKIEDGAVTSNKTAASFPGLFSVDAVLTTVNQGVILSNPTLGNTVTLTLPTAGTAAGVSYTVKNIGEGTVAVSGNGATIDGLATTNVDVQYGYVTLICDGVNWYKTAEYLPDYFSDVTPGVVQSNKAVVVDGNRDIRNFRQVAVENNTGTENDAFYWGDPDTDGSWKATRTAAGLKFEKRVSGSWQPMMEIE